MVKIKHIVRYFVEEYPYKEEISKTRLTKMVYLADWYNALEYGEQLTDIEWYFDHYGPYVVEVYNAVVEDSRLTIEDDTTPYGSQKQIIRLKESHFEFFYSKKLEQSVIEILNKVIEDTRLMYWSDFINYVYNTYPIKNSSKYTKLDLKSFAWECKNEGYKI